MNKKILVTGASGHIGNSLVRALLQSGKRVVAAVRGPKSERLFNSPQCEMVNIDLQDKHSTSKALQGTDTLYHTGTAFRDLASAPGSSGYDTCLRGNRNVMEAAAEAGIRRLVYISSLAALDRSAPLIHEGSWNPGMDNIYFRAETDAEKLAWSLADEFGLEMISALPSAAVGMNGAGINCGGMTLTMRLLKAVLEGTLAVDPGFHFNFIHVEDVVSGILAAAERGHPGERYLLANESAMSIREVVALAQEAFPERHIRTPVSLPSSMLWVIVAAMETSGWYRSETDRQLAERVYPARAVRHSQGTTGTGFRPSLPSYGSAPGPAAAKPVQSGPQSLHFTRCSGSRTRHQLRQRNDSRNQPRQET